MVESDKSSDAEVTVICPQQMGVTSGDVTESISLGMRLCGVWVRYVLKRWRAVFRIDESELVSN